LRCSSATDNYDAVERSLRIVQGADSVKRHSSGGRPPDDINQERRRLLGVAATALASTWLDAARTPAHVIQAGTAGVATMARKAGPTFGTLKQVEAGVLNVGYVETGPADGRVVLLLHGWPYDVHTYAEVAPRLEAAGYRVIVPYLRGYGTTRFRSADTLRNGQQSALAQDAIAMMDALGIRQAIVGGCDWGARTANIMAALWPDRCKGMVSVSGYLIGNRTAAGTPLVPEAEYQWWYQYYFATERGRAGYEKYRREFARLIWRLASPEWHFDDVTFATSAAAFDNPDHVAIVIHNYRWRLGLAAGEPTYDELERRLAAGPAIRVPTITLEGDANGAPHPDASAYADKSIGTYAHRVVRGGVGHNLPQEAPGAFAQAIMDVDRMHSSHNPGGSHEHDRKP
jgi:pimeloyl-ACP methyl ester carboxylesterase